MTPEFDFDCFALYLCNPNVDLVVSDDNKLLLAGVQGRLHIKICDLNKRAEWEGIL